MILEKKGWSLRPATDFRALETKKICSFIKIISCLQLLSKLHIADGNMHSLCNHSKFSFPFELNWLKNKKFLIVIFFFWGFLRNR